MTCYLGKGKVKHLCKRKRNFGKKSGMRTVRAEPYYRVQKTVNSVKGRKGVSRFDHIRLLGKVKLKSMCTL